MTNTASSRRPPGELSIAASQVLSRSAGESLVDQIVRSIETRIDDKLLRTGARMQSIRQFAEQHGVSRFTVVEAYDRLVARGYLESRRGSGFYVRERAPLAASRPAPSALDQPQGSLDVVWLVRNMFRQHPPQNTPGSGLLPSDWLDGELIANGLRAISRQNQALLLQYGNPQGFVPLRQQLQLKLAELEIAATPEQILTTSGITQALDLVARHFTQPGDTIFVDDPAWFLMFGSFATMGLKVVGIPRLSDGPDIAKLAELAAAHKPKLFVINSVLHNPTSTSLSAAKAFQVLKIAELHDFTIVEDDIYCDLHPGSSVQPATRIASLDQLNRVIYLGGFSKTLAANLRVGFIATSVDNAKRLADRKMLSVLATSDLGERIVYKILSEGHYRKHVDRLRVKLDGVRDRTAKQLERVGVKVDMAAPAGIFLWVDAGCDTNVLAEKGVEAGYVFAPGSLFSPSQLPSTRMRMNVSCMSDAAVLRFLERELKGAK
ncbi:PLP-dependent aminotransferase family protein [Oxalobacteraceae bacterium OM1]|nr:PLP-dependent aminotransferase family protein [Oxalobacteraceae bacterium OM1]